MQCYEHYQGALHAQGRRFSGVIAGSRRRASSAAHKDVQAPSAPQAQSQGQGGDPVTEPVTAPLADLDPHPETDPSPNPDHIITADNAMAALLDWGCQSDTEESEPT
eukprot:2229716-Prymnesium_polylepis.1